MHGLASCYVTLDSDPFASPLPFSKGFVNGFLRAPAPCQSVLCPSHGAAVLHEKGLGGLRWKTSQENSRDLTLDLRYHQSHLC